MRRLFILVLVALLLGVALVAAIESEPGYVLLAYGNYTLEASLWVGLILFVLVMLLLYSTIAVLHKLLLGRRSVRGWLGARKGRQSAQLTSRGLINYIEGNWQPARRQLLRGARHAEAPLINYLVAARASYQLGEMDQMREYLGEAEQADAQAGIAVELTQAEMKLAAGQYEQAVATLVRARRNAGRHPHVLDLLRKGYLGLRDWPSLAALIPELKRHHLLDHDAMEALEREVYGALLRESGRGEDDEACREALKQAWQATPAEWRRDPALLRAYVALLITHEGHDAASRVCVRALKQSWDAELARLYAFVHLDDPAKQLSQAENWLDGHEADAELLLCLGRLAARGELWGKARDYLERSYQVRRSPEVCAELGRLLAALGEPGISARYYEEGLLRDVTLPELPMPETGPARLALKADR